MQVTRNLGSFSSFQRFFGKNVVILQAEYNKDAYNMLYIIKYVRVNEKTI